MFDYGVFNRHVPLQKLLPHVLELPENEELYKEVLQRVSLTEVGRQHARYRCSLLLISFTSQVGVSSAVSLSAVDQK